jgi:ABC-type glycerol-3-phosphate transport system substrate-binding protein
MADGPQLTTPGKIFALLFIAGCFAGAYYLFAGRGSSTRTGQSVEPAPSSGGLFGSKTSAEIGIAFGTEKQRWLEWAAAEFAKSPQGKQIKVNLIPMGSIESAHALLAGDQRIDVWSPASAAYKDVFVEDWQVKYSANPIAKEEALALTPMVFVMWEERYQAFLQKYKTVSFATIGQALQEKGGWESIANHPEWGFFKFGHTSPMESNSGMMALVLAAYSHQHKTRGLELKDIVDVEFQTWLQQFERGVSGMTNSTGNMMREMVLKGPSSYDALLVYEAVTIDYLKNAEGRWGQIRVVYPEYNAWNESPYYIIAAPWVSKDQRKAAEEFLAFLLSEPVQKESLKHGFRPANPNVPVRFPESPFVMYAKYGIQVDLQKVCDPPKAEVVNNLLTSWQRSQGSR